MRYRGDRDTELINKTACNSYRKRVHIRLINATLTLIILFLSGPITFNGWSLIGIGLLDSY